MGRDEKIYRQQIEVAIPQGDSQPMQRGPLQLPSDTTLLETGLFDNEDSDASDCQAGRLMRTPLPLPEVDPQNRSYRTCELHWRTTQRPSTSTHLFREGRQLARTFIGDFNGIPSTVPEYRYNSVQASSILRQPLALLSR